MPKAASPTLSRRDDLGKPSDSKDELLALMALTKQDGGDDHFKEWYELFLRRRAAYVNNPAPATRLTYRKVCQAFIDIFGRKAEYADDPKLVAVCIKYLRLFKDPSQLLAFFEAYNIGRRTEKYYVALGLYYEFDQKDLQMAARTYDQGLALLPTSSHGRLLKEKKRLLLAQMRTQSSGQQNDIGAGPEKPHNSLLLGDITTDQERPYVGILDDVTSPEEQRLYEFYNNKRVDVLTKQNYNPYLLMQVDECIVSFMVHLLAPLRSLIVYSASSSSELITSTEEAMFIPYFERPVLRFIEETDDFSAVLAPDTSMTVCSGVLLSLIEEVGCGAFGKVFKAELVEAKSLARTLVGVKFFTRKKDQFEMQHQDFCIINSSLLREAYALAIVETRIRHQHHCFTDYVGPAEAHSQKDSQRRQTVILNNRLTTRLMCVILNSRGRGAICMEYLSGMSMLSLCKRHSSRVNQGLTCLPESLIIWFAYKMIEALRQIHSCHVVHTDVKVDNWIVTVRDHDLSVYGQRNSRNSFTSTSFETEHKICMPILCDLGKAIDLELLSVGSYPVFITKKALSSVTPTPIVTDTWSFEPDISGAAACIFFIITGKSIKQYDLSVSSVGNVTVSLPNRRQWKKYPQFSYLLSRLYAFSCSGAQTFKQQVADVLEFETELMNYLKPYIDTTDTLEFTDMLGA